MLKCNLTLSLDTTVKGYAKKVGSKSFHGLGLLQTSSLKSVKNQNNHSTFNRICFFAK